MKDSIALLPESRALLARGREAAGKTVRGGSWIFGKRCIGLQELRRFPAVACPGTKYKAGELIVCKHRSNLRSLKAGTAFLLFSGVAGNRLPHIRQNARPALAKH